MMRISAIEAPNELRLVLEGKLITPWTIEVKNACDRARQILENRELVVDLKNLTAISTQGEHLLVALMKEGVKFRSSDVFAKEVLRQVARKTTTAP
jgi:anti-anti-sigma regulatory factor